jgi:hypothetical protein
MDKEITLETEPLETIIFDPPIKVSEDKIVGGTVVTSAEINPPDGSGMVIARILPIGYVMGFPFVDSNENSIRVGLN